MQLEVNIARKAFTNAAGERHDVLADFNFALGPGEIGVFVGPSGCGKSTMLKIVAGLDHDYQGGVVYPTGARIGMVFQEPRLLPWRSVDDNVRLAAPKADDEKLSALFAILELTAHRNHYPGELSLGLARRAVLARAFAIEPDFLILDEPLASLDDALAVRLREQIATLVDSRCATTLLVTHDVAMRFASAIACSCCRRDRHGFSPNYLSAHRAARVAKPKLQRSRQTSRGGPTATAPSEMLDRQGLGCVLKYRIGGVVNETPDPNSSARPRSSRCDSNCAGHDAPR